MPSGLRIRCSVRPTSGQPGSPGMGLRSLPTGIGENGTLLLMKVLLIVGRGTAQRSPGRVYAVYSFPHDRPRRPLGKRFRLQVNSFFQAGYDGCSVLVRDRCGARTVGATA